MKFEGGCYCGALRYQAEGEPVLKAQCHCRECQYVTGGAPNYFMAMPASGFSYSRGTPKSFTRRDLEHPVTREFCAECGTHIITRPVRPGIVVVKVGTLDEPTRYGGPSMAIYAIDKQDFHPIAQGLPTHERVPW